MSRFFKLTLLIVCILATYGYWADFIPNDPFSVANYGLGVYGGAAICFLLAKQPVHVHRGSMSKVLDFTLFFVLGGVGTWLSITHGLPAMYTRMLGHERIMELKVQKEFFRSIKSCSYRLVGSSLVGAMPDYMCVSEDFFNGLGASEKLQAEVKLSVFGTYILRIEQGH